MICKLDIIFTRKTDMYLICFVFEKQDRLCLSGFHQRLIPYLHIWKVTWLTVDTQDTAERTERRKKPLCQWHILLRVLQQQNISGTCPPPVRLIMLMCKQTQRPTQCSKKSTSGLKHPPVPWLSIYRVLT